MTGSVLLTDFEEGHEFERQGFRVTPDWVRTYLEVAGDTSQVYFDHSVAPPLGILARGLGQFMDQTPLPEGTLHRDQTLINTATIPLDAYVEITSSIVERRVGRVRTVVKVEFHASLYGYEGNPVLTATTTLLILNMSAVAGRGDESKEAKKATGEFPWSSEHAMNQGNVVRYADLVNDHNPIHLDPEFAATTPFGGTIVHGMLVLASVPALLVSRVGMPWLESGSLDVHFGAPTLPTDKVTTLVRMDQESDLEQIFAVQCRKQDDTLLIDGHAKVLH